MWVLVLAAVAAAAAAGDDTLAPCLTPRERASAPPPPGAAAALQLSIRSAADARADIYWVDTSGEETPFGHLQPHGQTSVTTYRNHLWRVRAVSDDALLHEVRVAPDAGRRVATDFEDCKRPEGAAKTAADDSADGASVHAMDPLSLQRIEMTDEAAWSRLLDASFPQCRPREDLAEDAVPGFWVLCAADVDAASGGGGERGGLRMAAFRSSAVGAPAVVFTVPAAARSSVLGMRHSVRTALGLRADAAVRGRGRPKLPDWVLWEASGRRKVHLAKDMRPQTLTANAAGAANARAHGTGRLFLFEAGNFIWPGLRVGHERSVGTVAGRDKAVVFKTMSLRPLVFEVDNFLSPAECDHIIALAEPHMGQSVVNRMDGDEGKDDTTWRTSTTHFLSRGQTPLAKQIERRIFDATRVPITHGEGTQVLRYEKSQHYYTHHDFFEPARYRNSQSTLKMIEHGAKNRLATVFWYMSTVEKGGQTNFPRAGGLPPPRDTHRCTQGLLVEARRGKVIVFFNMLPDGSLDELSLHAGCSVEKGLKWAANKWLWNKPTHGSWRGDAVDAELYARAENVPGDGDVAVEGRLARELRAEAGGQGDAGEGAAGVAGLARWGLGLVLVGALLFCLLAPRMPRYHKN